MRLSPEELAARNRRSQWIALALVAFIILIFSTTFLRMQANFAERKAQQAMLAEPTKR